MLIKAAESYVALRRAAGFSYRTAGPSVLSFARFAAARGETHVRTQTAIEWARQGRAAQRREYRLRLVAGFARHLSAEDPAHEIPPTGLLGPSPDRRPTPFIFTQAQIRSLVRAAHRLDPSGSFRSQTYAALFSLLASTGLRIAEALALRVDDVTDDGLQIRMTKFRKSRLVPLHRTAQRGLRKYLAVRGRRAGDSVFIHPDGRPLPYAIVNWTFRKLMRVLHLWEQAGQPRPRLHCLRHTFAVRALEACPNDRLAVARHQLALTTYLGHVHLESTYWYLQATPHLLRDVAAQCESRCVRGVP
jgi:integrase